jgi:hypothetical protein
MGFEVYDSEFRVQDLGFRLWVQGVGFGHWGIGFRI